MSLNVKLMIIGYSAHSILLFYIGKRPLRGYRYLLNTVLSTKRNVHMYIRVAGPKDQFVPIKPQV